MRSLPVGHELQSLLHLHHLLAVVVLGAIAVDAGAGAEGTTLHGLVLLVAVALLVLLVVIGVSVGLPVLVLVPLVLLLLYLA